MTWPGKCSKKWQTALRDHRRLALNEPCYFAVCYLGMKYYPCQHEWTKNFGCKRLFHAAPRDHGKSVIYAFVLPLWELVRRPETRIVLVSKTQELSNRFVGAIRREIESNSRLQKDFGLMKPESPPPLKWSANQLYCRRKYHVREPSVRAISTFGSCTGLRADLIIADDLVDSAMCASAHQRGKVRDWFFSELTPILEPDGRLLVIGTRKHFDDLYAHLMETPGYHVVVERAIIDEEKKKVLMPEKWTYERLVEDRRELGSVLFNREKQNEVIDEASALFPLRWLEACLDESLCLGSLPDGLNVEVYQGIDLAMVTGRQQAQSRDSDYSVILTLAVLSDGTRIVADYYRQRGLTPDELTRAIVREARRWNPARIVLENNLFQRLYELELIRRSDLPILGHTTTRKKADPYEGVPALSVLFENRKILLPWGDENSREKMSILMNELHGLGVEKHDDLVMALWLANKAAPLHYQQAGDPYSLFQPEDLMLSIPKQQ